MKPVAFEYVRPADLRSAISELMREENSPKLVAGGQSLGPMLNLRLARPSLLVDIAALDELRTSEDCGSYWRVGSAVTHAEIEDGGTALGRDTPLSAVARTIAYRSIRNRGTIGGSLAHADPAADWPLVLSALGATANVQGPAGGRRIACAELMTAAFTTTLAENEVLVSVDVPKTAARVRWGYLKLCRKVGEFPHASAAVAIDPDTGSHRIFLGALGGPPQRLAGFPPEAPALQFIPTDALHDAVLRTVPELDPLDQTLFVGCLERALRQAFHQ